MKVIIVGSGIAGLTAAIGFRRAGHRVRVFERASSATAFGAGIGVSYNTSKILTSYGLDYKVAKINAAETTVVCKGDSLQQVMVIDQREQEKMFGSKQYYAHRVDLHLALECLATHEGVGQPAEIVYDARVDSYDAEAGSITLTDGRKYTSDLVVAADGVHSLALQHVLRRDYNTAHTGTTVIRFTLPTEKLLSDPQTSPLVGSGRFTFYMGPDRHRWMLQYPLKNNTVQQFAMYSVKSKDHEIATQEHRFKSDRESLSRELEGFHKSLLAIVPKTAEILPLWKLLERPPLPTWHRGRLVLIGDAAHPMLPHRGQGAGMSIEDSGALGVIFSNMTDTSPTAISERLALFESVRKGRASIVQLVSRVPFIDDAVEIMQCELLKHLPKEKLPKAGGAPLRAWIGGYNVLEDSKEALEKFLGGRSSE